MRSSQPRDRTAPTRRRRLGDEDGQVLILTVLAMFVMVAMAAFVIDVSLLYMARHRAQVAADAGALAAVHQLQTTSGAVTTAADTYAGYNSSGNNTVGVTLPGGINGNEVDVSVKHPVSLLFGSVFGLGNASVSASAAAAVNGSPGVVPNDGQISPSAPGDCTAESSDGYPFYECYAVSTIGTSGGNETWTVFSGSVDVQPCNGAVGGACDDTSGKPLAQQQEVVDLNGDNAGAMDESLSTVAGDTYVLSFYLSGNPAGENCNYDTFTGYINVAPTAASGGVTQQSFSHTNACSNGTETANFQVVDVPFVATSSTTTIYLASTTQVGYTGGYADYGPEVTNFALNYGSSELIK